MPWPRRVIGGNPQVDGPVRRQAPYGHGRAGRESAQGDLYRGCGAQHHPFRRDPEGQRWAPASDQVATTADRLASRMGRDDDSQRRHQLGIGVVAYALRLADELSKGIRRRADASRRGQVGTSWDLLEGGRRLECHKARTSTPGAVSR